MKKKKTATVDISSSAEALGLPFSEEEWKATPTVVRRFIIEHEKTIAKLSERVEELERLVEKLIKCNSSNSDQPPLSDSPCRKPGASKEKEKKSKEREIILKQGSSYWSPPKLATYNTPSSLA